MTDPDNFQISSDALMKWFLQNASAKFNPKVALADMRHQGAGRGLVALADIDEDEELFAIPRSSVLSAETSELKDRIPKEMESMNPWLRLAYQKALILVMIYEYLQGPRSKWKPYFDVLPEIFDTLMFWSDAELAELQGSAVLQKIGKLEAEKTFRDEIIPMMQAHPDLFAPTPAESLANAQEQVSEAECLALAHRMGSLILAYSFDIEKDEDRSSKSGEQDGYVTDDDDDDEEENLLAKGMVPMADMLNADADRNNETLIMQATNHIPKGAEIFNDYGPLPRSDLLRRYGYLTDNYAKYDVVEIPTGMIVEETTKYLDLDADEQQRRGHDVLEESGYDLCLPTESTSVFLDELLIAVQSLLLPKEQLSGRHLRKGIPKPVKTEEVVAVLREVVRRRQRSYATTLEQDEVLIQNGLTGRKLLAVLVRVGEKRILKKAIEELDSTLIMSEADAENSHRGIQTAKRRQESPLGDGDKRSRYT
ncbi:MAG: hypothetical protein M1816_002126 [Peltula sp. TS41687]|nr:MAG: hypothetical protein M1816_002126 [Peltula sp. TS41687]